MKDLILTTAINYDYEKIKLFLNSLNTFYTGELVIFSSRQYKLKHLSYKLTVIDTEDELVKNASEKKFNLVVNARFYWYLNFLERKKYDRILMVDSRDVYFQSNPFNKIKEDLLHVAVEDNTFANCPFNSNWIRTIYGEGYLTKIGHLSISCAGTTMGTYMSTMAYLLYMTSELEKVSGLDTYNNVFNLDQAIHNYYCIEFSNKIKRFTNNDELFLTLGYTENVKLNKEGLLVSNNDQAYTLVHQFDRINWLSNHFEYQVKDSIKKNNHLNLSFKNGIRKNIQEYRRYIAEEQK